MRRLVFFIDAGVDNDDVDGAVSREARFEGGKHGGVVGYVALSCADLV